MKRSPIVMSEMFILILNLFRHFYWKSHSWRFPKCAECGRFHFPATRCNLSRIFWRLSRSDRFRSNYIELTPGDISIVIHCGTILSIPDARRGGWDTIEFSSW